MQQTNKQTNKQLSDFPSDLLQIRWSTNASKQKTAVRYSKPHAAKLSILPNKQKKQLSYLANGLRFWWCHQYGGDFQLFFDLTTKLLHVDHFTLLLQVTGRTEELILEFKRNSKETQRKKEKGEWGSVVGVRCNQLPASASLSSTLWNLQSDLRRHRRQSGPRWRVRRQSAFILLLETCPTKVQKE